MAEKPILMNDEMVRAILDGHKTQTRRPMKPQPTDIRRSPFVQSGLEDVHGYELRPRYWPGDRLWVKETFYVQGCLGLPLGERQPTHYAADIMCRDEVEDYTCKPSIHMPRWASRITLGVTEVRAERVQDISTGNVVAEGFADLIAAGLGATEHFDQFYRLWDSIYAKRGLGIEENPWVWVYTFKRRP
jgi:hypothetical protein